MAYVPSDCFSAIAFVSGSIAYTSPSKTFPPVVCSFIITYGNVGSVSARILLLKKSF